MKHEMDRFQRRAYCTFLGLLRLQVRLGSDEIQRCRRMAKGDDV